MATLVLSTVGRVVGTIIGGPIGGAIGQAIGATIGSAIDNYLFAPSLRFTQEGPRLQDSQVFTAVEGQPIIRGYGRFRVPGNMIWATRFREEVVKETTKQGGKGGGGGSTTTTATYNYYANFAVGLCEGVIQNVHRVWADGKLIDLSDYTHRIYTGTESQTADSLIETKEGSGNVPGYRGLAYIVFEDMQINQFGNRIPQLSFEITKPVRRSDNDAVGDLITGVDLIPGTTEFGYDPNVIDQVLYANAAKTEISERRVENNHVLEDTSDWEIALDQLEDNLPNCNIVTLVVTWFGDDLRIGNCTIKPKVENNTKATDPISWTVAGLTRDTAGVVSTYDGNAAFGGSPNDLSVYRAILDLKSRGFEVMFYPFIIMDIEDGNTLPNPYSANAASTGQAVYPWRGRITCSPAIGYTGTVDQTAIAKTQIDTFLGTADASEFSGSGGAVTYSGTTEWSYRRFILHMAELCRQAGGVDYFCIGTEMVGATNVRDDLGDFPFVDGLVDIAAEVATLLPSANLGYAADWSEYHSYRPDDGSGDVYFHLDKLWGDSNVDFVGIDNYLPISDWRDGTSHDDYGSGNDSYGNAKGDSLYNIDYLKGQIEGGEYYDWYYASISDRISQTRTAITDGEYGEDYVYGNKRMKEWWQNGHRDRPGGSRKGLSWGTSGAVGNIPDSWVASGATITADASTYKGYSDAADFASNGSTSDTARTGAFDGVISGGEYLAQFWVIRDPNSTNTVDGFTLLLNITGMSNPEAVDSGSGVSAAGSASSVTETDLGSGISRVDIEFTATVTDATVFLTAGPNSATSGDSIVVIGAELIRTDAVDGSITDWTPESKPIIFTEFGCPAINKGTNQPNVFYDPKSSESFIPYFSSGARDDEIQRQYIRAMTEYWGNASNNPTSTVYADEMVDTTRMCYWSYDARPWPTFPANGDTWADVPNWQYGHWISGRVDTVFVPDLLEALAEDYGLSATYDFSKAYGSCDGFIIQSKTSFRSTVEALATLFMFNIIESGDQFKAVSEREVRSLVTVDLDDIAEADGDKAEPVTLTRMQETELPAELSIRYVDILSEYEPASVTQQREVVQASGAPVTDTPIVIDFARAQQIVDRLLYSAWSKRTRGDFGLLPEFIYLEPGDVVTINDGVFNRPLRLEDVSDGNYRKITGRSFDSNLFDSTEADGRSPPVFIQPVASAPLIALMDLPTLRSTDNGWQPYAASYVNPWPGVNVYKSITTSNYTLDSTLGAPTVIGQTTATFNSGVTDIWDNANELKVEIYSDSLETVTEEVLFNGANTLAIENSSGGWEVLQFLTATLTGTRQYTLTGLLRGQLGTEDNMEDALASGARIVLIESTLQQLQLGIGDIGREYYYKYGPADLDIGDSTYNVTTKTFNARGLKPFSPVHVIGTDSSGDIIISWVRRDRIGADSWEYTEDVPMSEAYEKYEVDILDGSDNVVRTLTVTDATQVTYTSAQQSADSISSPFDCIVYQISDQIGRGTGRRATINV